MVTTFLPSTDLRSTEQERTAVPSTCTVQAPHRPAPQPYLVPVNPTWSRMTQSSGVVDSASTETRLSFNVNETMSPPLADALCPASMVARAYRGQPPSQARGLRLAGSLAAWKDS